MYSSKASRVDMNRVCSMCSRSSSQRGGSGKRSGGRRGGRLGEDELGTHVV